MGRFKSDQQLLAALAEGNATAARELGQLAEGNHGVQLRALAQRAAAEARYASARPAVARIAVPHLARWVSWRELRALGELVELYGVEPAMLHALTSNLDHVRAEADAAYRKLGGDVAARARRMLAMLDEAPFQLARMRGVALVLLATLADAGVAPAPAHDALISFSYEPTVVQETKRLRAVLATMPMARRIALLAGQARRASGARRRIYKELLDLAPELSATLLAQADPGGALREQLGERELTRWRGKLPAVAKILATFEGRLAKAAPPPKPPPRPVGPFTFEGPVAVTPADYKALDAVGKAQYRTAAGAYVGGRPVKDPRDFVARLKREELDVGDAELRRWRVLRGGAHAFDLWVVWVDNGSFFVAGRPTRAPVQIIQGSFLPLDKRPASAELARLLAASEPKTGLWSAGKRARRRAR